MFEFLKGKADDLLKEIEKVAGEMETDAEVADSQAQQYEDDANKAESDASAEEAMCPHYNEIFRIVTNEDGTTETISEKIQDLAADAESKARAAMLRMKAKALRESAKSLRTLVDTLRTQLDNMDGQKNKFQRAIDEVVDCARSVGDILNGGTDALTGVIEKFATPVIDGAIDWGKEKIGEANTALKNVGIDLSDGFDKNDIYGIVGTFGQKIYETGATIVKSYTSTIINDIIENNIIGPVGSLVVRKFYSPNY